MAFCLNNVTIFTPVGDNGVMWFMLVSMPIIVIVGVIGNVLSYIILKKGSAKVSSYFYIRYLTIFDSLTLITTLFGYYAVLVVHPILLCNYKWYVQHSDMWVKWGSCQARTYLAFTSRTLSTWTIVMFSLERMIAVRFPMYSLKYCTVKTAKIIILILIGVALISNLNWIFSFERKTNVRTKVDLCKSKDSMLKFRVMDSVLLSIVPSIIICICNIIILYTLRERFKKAGGKLIAYQDPNYKKRDLKVTLQLLVVSFAFVLLTIPNCISVIINTIEQLNDIHDYRSGILADFFHITFFLFTMNFGINFLLYCFIGYNFRLAAWNLLLCRFERMVHYRRALFETITGSRTNETKLESVRRDTTIGAAENKWVDDMVTAVITTNDDGNDDFKITTKPLLAKPRDSEV